MLFPRADRLHLRLLGLFMPRWGTPLLLVLFSSTGYATDALADWAQLGGPVPPVASRIGKTGDVLLFGSDEADQGDLFRSVDGGATWANAGVPNPGVTMLEADGPRTFLGLYLDGMRRSTDSGTSWEPVYPARTVTSLARVGGLLFVGTASGAGDILRSTDDGATWAPLGGAPSFPISDLATDGTVLLAGTPAGGVFRSTDAGMSWTQGIGIPPGSDVVAILSGDGVFYAGVSKPSDTSVFGVFRSVDGGASWSKWSLDLTGSFNHYFRRLRARNGELFAAIASEPGDQGGLHRSADGGLHWEELTTTLTTSQSIEDMLLEDGGGIVIATQQGLYRSDDLGTNWVYASEGTAAIRGVSDLVYHAGWLLVGLTTNGSVGEGTWRTADLGESWALATGLPGHATVQAFLDRGSEVLAAVVGEQRGVWRSTDAGASWFSSSSGLPTSVNFLSLYDDGDDVVYAGTWDSLHRSTNGGASWGPVSGAPQRITSMIRHHDELLAGTYGTGVWRSTNDGVSWSALNSGLTELFTHQLLDFEGTLVLATNGDGVFRLEGSAWVPTGLDHGFVNGLLEVNGALLAADALDGFFYTTDLETWTPFTEGYFGGEVYELERTDTHIVAGSRGHSVWARPLSDLPEPTAVPENAASPEALFLDARLLGNPVGHSGTLRYQLARDTFVQALLVDAAGRVRATLHEGEAKAGPQVLHFDLGGEFPSGVWFLRLVAEGSAETLPVVHVK